MSAGYSKRSLVQKLGIKDGFAICIIAAPETDVRIGASSASVNNAVEVLLEGCWRSHICR
jgi:hypothetical protein